MNAVSILGVCYKFLQIFVLFIGHVMYFVEMKYLLLMNS